MSPRHFSFPLWIVVVLVCECTSRASSLSTSSWMIFQHVLSKQHQQWHQPQRQQPLQQRELITIIPSNPNKPQHHHQQQNQQDQQRIPKTTTTRRTKPPRIIARITSPTSPTITTPPTIPKSISEQSHLLLLFLLEAISKALSLKDLEMAMSFWVQLL